MVFIASDLLITDVKGKIFKCWSQLEVGMGRANTRAGPSSATWAAGRSRSRSFISGPHRHEPAWVRPRAKRSFPLFFSLKLSKIQKNNIKYGPAAVGTNPARGPGPWTKFGNFKTDPARPPFPQARGPGPCQV